MINRALMLCTLVFGAVFFYYWYVRGENILFDQQRATDVSIYTYATRLPADRPSTREPGPRWEAATPMPTKRTEAASAVLSGRIHVMGGMDSFGRDLDTVEVFDTTLGDWKKSVPLPVPLHGAAAETVEGKIFLLGGLEGVTGKPMEFAYAYYPLTAEWREIAKPPRAIGAMATVVQGTEIHVFGGRTAIGASPEYLIYDTVADTWREGEEMLTAIEAAGAGTVGGTFYVYGGRAGSSLDNSRRMEAYSPEAKYWERLAEMPNAKSGFGSAVIKGVLYVFGGKAPTITHKGVDAFDPAKGLWTTVSEMPTPRYGAATEVVNGKVFIIGGSPRPGFSVSDVVDVFIP